MRSWYIEQETPESDGWVLLVARARTDRWVCPIHALEINDVVDRTPEVKRAFEVGEFAKTVGRDPREVHRDLVRFALDSTKRSK